jgi:hypothetical protein
MLMKTAFVTNFTLGNIRHTVRRISFVRGGAAIGIGKMSMKDTHRNGAGVSSPGRGRFLLMAVVGLILWGCGQPKLVVEAVLVDSAGERTVLTDLPVRLLPYNRGAIFDSLRAAFGTPEPAIPADVLANLRRAQEARAAWREAERRWTGLRDSVQVVQEQLQRAESANQRESAGYAESSALRGRLIVAEREADGRRQAAFMAFGQARREMGPRADSIRLERERWATAAYAAFGEVAATKLRESGRAEIADTTDAQGIARLSAPEGEWWLYGRYALPYEELYWNLPIRVEGDSASVRIDQGNAEVRAAL